MAAPNQIRVLDPLVQAYDRMTLMLFGPFDFQRWLLLAFVVMMANCGSGGQNASGNFTQDYSSIIPSADTQQQREELARQAGQVLTFFDSYVQLIFLGLFLAALIGLAISAVIAYFGSHFHFVLMDQCAKNHDQVSTSWTEYSPVATSLFIFRLILLSIQFTLGFLFLVIIAFLSMRPLIETISTIDDSNIALDSYLFDELMSLLLYSSPLILISIGFLLLGVIINNFVIPIMYARQLKFYEAFSKTLGIITTYPGSILLYLLVRLLAFAAAMLAVTLLSCGSMLCPCFWIFICIPFMNTYFITFVGLPAFLVLYLQPMVFLEQFGPKYRVFGEDDPAHRSDLPPAIPSPLGIPGPQPAAVSPEPDKLASADWPVRPDQSGSSPPLMQLRNSQEREISRQAEYLLEAVSDYASKTGASIRAYQAPVAGPSPHTIPAILDKPGGAVSYVYTNCEPWSIQRRERLEGWLRAMEKGETPDASYGVVVISPNPGGLGGYDSRYQPILYVKKEEQ